MTRHGRDPNRTIVFRGCGMAVGRDDDGRLIPCDRTKWHKGECSTLEQRRAARREAKASR